jgi:hypothetical protein
MNIQYTIETMAETFTDLCRGYLSCERVLKQDVLLALAAASARVIKEEPIRTQADLDDFISPSIAALIRDVK